MWERPNNMWEKPDSNKKIIKIVKGMRKHCIESWVCRERDENDLPPELDFIISICNRIEEDLKEMRRKKDNNEWNNILNNMDFDLWYNIKLLKHHLKKIYDMQKKYPKNKKEINELINKFDSLISELELEKLKQELEEWKNHNKIYTSKK